jgi:hypothetical protein
VISPTQGPLPDNTQHSKETDIDASGGIRSRTAIPASERPQTHALDRAATGMGKYNNIIIIIIIIIIKL